MFKKRISNIEILRENILSEQQKKGIIEQWRVILGLTQIPIKFHFIIDVGDIPFYKEKGKLGFCGYGIKDQKYHIVLTPEANHYIIIHELGHIYLDKITNNLYAKFIPAKNWEQEIYLFKNGIVDSFTNYHLFQFYQFGQIYLENINNNWYISPKGNFGNILEFYIKTYLCYNFILREIDRGELLDCNTNLQRTKRILSIKGENMFNRPIKENLNRLDTHLDQFGKIKDTQDHIQIKKFIISGLKIVGLWPKEKVAKHIKFLRIE